MQLEKKARVHIDRPEADADCMSPGAEALRALKVVFRSQGSYLPSLGRVHGLKGEVAQLIEAARPSDPACAAQHTQSITPKECHQYGGLRKPEEADEAGDLV